MAAEKIVASDYESYDVVGFDKVEATRLGVSIGDIVQVAPEDSGDWDYPSHTEMHKAHKISRLGRNYPTTGKLVALNREEITLEVTGLKGLVRCHFPRLGFTIKLGATNKL